MAGFHSRQQAIDLDFRDTSTTKPGRLGTIAETPDGKVYRLGSAGAVDLAPGRMNAAAALVANHTNIAVQAAAALGATRVFVTLGATAATQDQYADGSLNINDNAGEGIDYIIKGHSAALSAGVLSLRLDDQIKVALTTATEVTLRRNPWSAVVIAPFATGVAQRAVGVNNVLIPATTFGWFQTEGDCAVLSDGVITKGAGAILSDAVDGALEIEVAGTVTGRYGQAPEATVDTEFRTITLKNIN